MIIGEELILRFMHLGSEWFAKRVAKSGGAGSF
jgi:hypothetical protein